MTLLPKDADNNVIPALRLKDNGAHIVTVTGTATSNNTAFDENTCVVSLYADVPFYIKFGDVGVTATSSDHYFPAGLYYDVALSGGRGKGAHHTHLSILRADGDGTLYVSEKE